ncbi:hypothetical protein IW262DRAFT_1488739 [Armillaria fumosa]|nr:hypothetical protein IW262DRAFT_1488739 [Armillaria fumosa]
MIKPSVDLPVAYREPHWCGESSLGNVVTLSIFPTFYLVLLIFRDLSGDSYSKPDLEEESAVWVDYLLKDTSICVHDLAFPSATVEDDLPRQLSRFFTCFPKKSPWANSDVPTLDSITTIYVLYLGINDCGGISSDELETTVEALLGAVHDLYIKAGAQNFVLVDVPPIGRSLGVLDTSDEIQDHVKTWNDLLRAHVSEFSTSSSQATVFVFSSRKVIADVLDDLLECDLGENDPDDEGGAIWEDDLHLTPATHAILADRLFSSLKAKDQ